MEKISHKVLQASQIMLHIVEGCMRKAYPRIQEKNAKNLSVTINWNAYFTASLGEVFCRCDAHRDNNNSKQEEVILVKLKTKCLIPNTVFFSEFSFSHNFWTVFYLPNIIAIDTGSREHDTKLLTIFSFIISYFYRYITHEKLRQDK